ncbi:MAG: CPBP family intramembrane glutamic endopeptidase [Ilumatobacteraceae bacterium]
MARSHPATNATRFPPGVVLLAWLAAYVAALPLQSLVLGLSGYSGESSDLWPTRVTALAALTLWFAFIVATVIVSRRFGSGRFADDLRLSFRPIDMIGLPLGVVSQLALVPALYWPLRQLWPETFATDRLSERAQELWDRAEGRWVIVLMLIVAVGAPLVEEIVYRGLIQQALQSRLNDVVAVVVAAAFFAFVHLQAIEFPGLFLFGLVLGTCFMRTGRLGMGILAHVGFNAVGLMLVA